MKLIPQVVHRFFYYRKLRSFIDQVKPRRIMEIGVGGGLGAKNMIARAKEKRKNVEYYGFDSFERTSEKEIRKALIKTGGKIHLFKGDSKKILPNWIRRLPKMDFVYIDGGHDYETVSPDWKNVQRLRHPRTIVVFDDFNFEGVRSVVSNIKNHRVKIVPAFPSPIPAPLFQVISGFSYRFAVVSRLDPL